MSDSQVHRQLTNYIVTNCGITFLLDVMKSTLDIFESYILEIIKDNISKKVIFRRHYAISFPIFYIISSIIIFIVKNLPLYS